MYTHIRDKREPGCALHAGRGGLIKIILCKVGFFFAFVCVCVCVQAV